MVWRAANGRDCIPCVPTGDNTLFITACVSKTKLMGKKKLKAVSRFGPNELRYLREEPTILSQKKGRTNHSSKSWAQTTFLVPDTQIYLRNVPQKKKKKLKKHTVSFSLKLPNLHMR